MTHFDACGMMTTWIMQAIAFQLVAYVPLVGLNSWLGGMWGLKNKVFND
jgi:hypothetical protein